MHKPSNRLPKPPIASDWHQLDPINKSKLRFHHHQVKRGLIARNSIKHIRKFYVVANHPFPSVALVSNRYPENTSSLPYDQQRQQRLFPNFPDREKERERERAGEIYEKGKERGKIGW